MLKSYKKHIRCVVFDRFARVCVNPTTPATTTAGAVPIRYVRLFIWRLADDDYDDVDDDAVVYLVRTTILWRRHPVVCEESKKWLRHIFIAFNIAACKNIEIMHPISNRECIAFEYYARESVCVITVAHNCYKNTAQEARAWCELGPLSQFITLLP